MPQPEELRRVKRDKGMEGWVVVMLRAGVGQPGLKFFVNWANQFPHL